MERRLKALSQKQGELTITNPESCRRSPILVVHTKPEPVSDPDDHSGSDSEGEDVKPETDQDRRRVLLESIDKSDLDDMKTSWSELGKQFIFPEPNTTAILEKQLSEPIAGPSRPLSQAAQPIIISDDEDDDHEGHDDTHILSSSRSTATSPIRSAPPKEKQKISYGSIVQDEIEQRKKEALGMSGPGRTLGGTTSTSTRSGKEPQRQQTRLNPLLTPIPLREPGSSNIPRPSKTKSCNVSEQDREWSCLVCTLWVS